MPRKQQITWLRIGRGVLVDLPWIIDSSLRHIDFAAFRLWTTPTDLAKGRERQIPQGTGLLCALNVFIIYGVTPDALCGIVPASWSRSMASVLPFGYLTILLGLAYLAYGHIRERIERRFTRRPKQKLRRRTLSVSVWTLLTLMFIGLGLGLKPLWDSVFEATTCHGAVQSQASFVQLLYTLALCGVSFFLLKKYPERARLIFVAALTFAVSFSLWFWNTDNSEANHQPYTTTLSVAVIPLILVAIASPILAKFFIRGYRAADVLKFPVLLKKTELFQKRTEPSLNAQRIWFAVLAPIFHHLVFLLFWPSLAATLAPIGYTTAFFWTVFVLAFFFVFQSSITDRWNQILLLVRRLLMTGLPLVLSVFVIVLGVLRLSDVQYVSIILDAAPFGAITMGIGSVYVLSWLFELAINRPVMVELLALFEKANKRADFVQDRKTRISCDIKKSRVRAEVQHRPRYLQLHGTGRFLVVGQRTRDGSKPAWHSYDRPGLFQRVLAAHAVKSEASIAWADLRRRVRAYFFVVNALVLLLFVSAWWSFGKYEWLLEREPLIVIKQQDLAGSVPFSLKDKLIEQKEHNKPAILIAASGGGTRAALYTASVLAGLTRQGVGDDIVLLSGVSGGSASVAYFAANRQRLLAGPPEERASNWHEFVNRITYPFIEDVIEGSAEIHSILNLSHLLEESIEDNLGLETGIRLADIQDVGLIFNSTVAGHPAGDSYLARSLIGSDTRGQQYVVSRGGRMVFTNLMHEPGLPGDGAYKEDSPSDATRFHLKVVRSSDVRVTQAVTTTANFPAVFPNSGVWVEDSKTESTFSKYSITDGGALDNRGIISMLYMLRSAIKSMSPDQLPDIHIVIADASAMSFDYSRDRGLAATFSASTKSQLADGLIRTLLSEICQEISNGADKSIWTESRIGCKTASIELHVLNMPTVFRSRGGIGTHWMMPTLVKLKDPGAVTGKRANAISVPCEELVETVMALHASPSSYCAAEPPEEWDDPGLRAWICGGEQNNPDPHVQSWKNIVRKLSSATEPLELASDVERAWRHCPRIEKS